MTLLLLSACGGPRPLEIAIGKDQVSVDRIAAVPVRELDAYPLDADLPPLATALADKPPQPFTLTAGGEDPWYRVRTVYLTTSKAGFGPATFELDGVRGGPTRTPPAGGSPGCASSVAATGARPTFRLDLLGDPAEAWVELSARFHPVIGGVVTDVPNECWSGPACDQAFPAGPAREACLGGEGGEAPDRVTLGGKTGCAASLAKGAADGAWAKDLTETLRGLGLTDADTVVISPEPRIPYRRFVEATEGVRAAGLPFPHIPDAMVQGNDGPPPCTAEIRDAAALALAAARWYGANHARD
jgi:hypothetical protein